MKKYKHQDLISETFQNESSKPTIDDLIGTVVGLFKLEDTYLIEPIQFAFQNLSKNYVSLKLSGTKTIQNLK
jgi:hypothetical protein